MERILEQFPIVVDALNVGFLQTLKLFAATLVGAIPLGLIIALGSMSRCLDRERNTSHDSTPSNLLRPGFDAW